MLDFLRRHGSTILKIAITTGGLAFVLTQIDIRAVGVTLAEADLRWFWVSLLLILFSLGLRAFRWQLLLKGLGKRVFLGRLIELYFVGNFFSAFLPGGVGGDAVRIVEVADDVSADIAAGTVLVDRMTGLMMQFLIVLIALPFRPDNFPNELFFIMMAVSIVGLLGSFVLLEGSLIRRFGKWLPGPLSPIGTGPVARVLGAVQGCGWPAVFKAMLVSLLFNFLLFGWWSTSARALGLPIPFGYMVLVVPMMSLALLLPSIGGLGTREVIAPILFAGANVGDDQAVALSLFVTITLRTVSLLGAFVYIASLIRKRNKPAATEQ